MDIKKIFETQEQLDAHIIKNHPVQPGEDRVSKKVLALLTELSECAQEWRQFKFWSNDQVPRTWKRVNCPTCEKKGFVRGNPPVDPIKGKHALGNHWYHCDDCAGFLVVDKNPLLEEYVDCLHFIVSIGIELNINPDDLLFPLGVPKDNAQDLFISLHQDIAHIDLSRKKNHHYQYTFLRFMELGLQLGFALEQIEDAYYTKNKINHTRQENGY